MVLQHHIYVLYIKIPPQPVSEKYMRPWHVHAITYSKDCTFRAPVGINMQPSVVVQLTFFVAWLTLDQRRLESRRNGCLCCCVHGENYKPSDISQKSISTAAFRLYGKLLTSWPVKLLILLAAVILAVVAGYGNILLRQEFNPTWFLPTDSYVARWFVKNKEYFPFGGDRVAVYLHEVDYTRDLAAIQELVVKLEAETDIIDEVREVTFSSVLKSTSNSVLTSYQT